MGLGSIAKVVGAAVLTLAVAMGLVGRLAPELFLKFDNGFILWAITGNPMPPYFDVSLWEPTESHNWLRDGDVVVATGAKSGTTWMLYTTHLIRTRGNEAELPFEDPMLNTPWLEMLQAPGAVWAGDQRERYNSTVLPEPDGRRLKDLWDNPAYPFRVFKSHFTPRTEGGALPVRERPGVKFLAMTRNGLDVLASAIPFFDAHSPEFRKMWGGFPPAGTPDPKADAEARLAELLPGGILEALYFAYVKQWWPLRNDPNVLLLHYTDAIANRAGTIRRIAEFVGMDPPLTDAEVDKIAELNSMASMKASTGRFEYRLPLNPAFGEDRVMRKGSMTRKGGVGSGKTVFTAEQQAVWRAAEEEMFTDPNLLQFARNGGQY